MIQPETTPKSGAS